MILYILLLLLFLLVLVLTAVERKRTLKEIRKFQNELSELNDLSIQFEILKTNIRKQSELDLQKITSTSELLNTTQKVEYEAYQKRGGTDDIPTWLMKSDLKNLFP